MKLNGFHGISRRTMNHQYLKTHLKQFILIAAAVFLLTSNISAQQIAISRIEKMPNLPSPYEMRNWKQVAIGYDSLVFNSDLTGQYLPLIWINSNTVNYPNHESFGLHSYVGTNNPQGAEAINILPAVISASLVGINKSSQDGNNWALMCEEFFNNRPAEHVYLNNPITSSGSDWWYDTMPNVFFYQLYDLYPGTGDFERQFKLVADRWLQATEKMGGSTAPWKAAYMNYRAWKLADMSPLTVGVKEPEAAGAIAWILYNAFNETGQENYRIGAEWAMEFLNNLTNNPSYELQLPYGVYMAARMNAELGTDYNIQKMINWCFDVKDNVRDWGATLGNWGGYDCYGLIGEAKFAGYAFIMNGFELAGALVPMVRYDDRFVRAVGKWMLNIANASRLFYANYLPENQDNEQWAQQYDPNSYLAYEALREYALHTGISPSATGDALENNWGNTNFALYGSSHVGIFGGIIDTTNVPMILKLDVLKTDYFNNYAYPTFLYFNPYDKEKLVEIDLGTDSRNLYDAATNTFLKNSVSGINYFPIAPNSAVLLTILPSNGAITYELDKMLVNDIIADYSSGQSVANYPPRIKSFSAKDTTVLFGSETTLYCTAQDKDNDLLKYIWTTDIDTTTATSSLIWTAPDSAGEYLIKCIVDDQKGCQDIAFLSINVVESINHQPLIKEMTGSPRRVEKSATSKLTCLATDPDGDKLNYFWSADYGTIEAQDSIAAWTAPATLGFYYIRCRVDDGNGGQDIDSLGIVVQDSSNITTGTPIAFYTFNGNANDESGFDNHGTVYGTTLTDDRFGHPNSAYYFNGSFDFIEVSNCDVLNFRDAITVSFWMKIGGFFSRESYIISHGSWQNRWKLSLTPEKRLRGTIYTTLGVKDLDSQILMEKDVLYNITALYDGANFEIYINGQLDNNTALSGLILTTNIDLTIGQELPNTDYNFKGVLDDIRIYNYAISKQEIQNIYEEITSIHENQSDQNPSKFLLTQNYPNPFNTQTTIQYQISEPGKVSLKIFDILGRRVKTLVDIEKSAGYYSINWDSKNDNGSDVTSGIYIYELKSHNFCQRKKLILVK